MSPLGFKVRVGSALFEYNIHSLRSTSGATPANLLAACITAGHSPICINRDGTWLRFEWAITQIEDERATRMHI